MQRRRQSQGEVRIGSSRQTASTPFFLALSHAFGNKCELCFSQQTTKLQTYKYKELLSLAASTVLEEVAARAVQNKNNEGNNGSNNECNLVVLDNSCHDHFTTIGELRSTSISSQSVAHVSAATKAVLKSLPSNSRIRRLNKLDGDVIHSTDNFTVLVVALDSEEGNSQNNSNQQAEEAADSNNERIDEEEASTARSAETNHSENNKNYTKDNSHANVGGQLLDDRGDILAEAKVNRSTSHKQTDEEQNNVHTHKATVLLFTIFSHCLK